MAAGRRRAARWPAAATAPASSWPSAPMFQKPARKAMATAAPVSRMGVAATSTSSSAELGGQGRDEVLDVGLDGVGAGEQEQRRR